MFWRFGGYANISTIDSVLDRPDVRLEDVLEESELLQELKQHNTKLIEYLRESVTFQRLLDYVVSPSLIKPEDDDEVEEEEEVEEPKKKSSFSPVRSLSLGRSRTEKSKRQQEKEDLETDEKARQKHAFVASEILSSEVWSITETLMDNRESLIKFWDFVRQPSPLDPVTAGYFTKINETLLDKKTEDTIDFIKSLDGIVPAMLQHVDCPMIMDLLLKIISMEKIEGGQGVVDWLQSQKLVPLLLAYLAPEHPTFTQTSAGDFIKAIITISANASQNEQSCIGPNSLTRQLVSESCIKPMIANMLKGGNPLTVGVGIIIEVIRKNNSDYDPESTGQDLPPSSSDPIYLGGLLRQFAIHVPEFMELIKSSKHTVSAGEATTSVKRKELPVAFGKSIEPLGFDRFKTCELMAELLHCSNMGLLNERGSEAYVLQRDAEREKLRAEGRFQKHHAPESATTEFSETSIDEKEDSPEFVSRPTELRKLEMCNSVEDDGFEDVGASRDVADAIRDDFDNDNTEPASPLKPSKSRLSLDDEFFDEPLHTPSQSGSSTRKPAAGPLGQAPDSTRSVAADVNSLQFEQNEHESTKSTPQISIADDLVAEIDAQLSPTKETSDQSSHEESQKSLSNHLGSPQLQSPSNLSPHLEDTPAPLFSPSSEHPPSKNETGDGQTTPTQTRHQADALWSKQSNDEWAPQLETDTDGRPIVGDFLKMQFVEHGVVPTILEFFFRFPWNNFLHNVVYDVVQQVFNGTMERGYNRALAIDLFLQGRITEQVIEGQLRSDEQQARNNLRLGYMGHLTLIAEEVVKFSERHPMEIISEPVLDKITEKLWTDYVENTLSETRDRDNAILGGVRPDAVGGTRQAVLDSVNAGASFSNTGSAALANAGLIGGAAGLDSVDLATSNSNFLSSGSLLSGFGSSSDEEDEDMEELKDGEGDTGFEQHVQKPAAAQDSDDSAETTTPILTPSSSGTSETDNTENPVGSSSFLPPPLKISPSRARRQLAVRLALKEKERQEEKERAEASGNVEGSEDVDLTDQQGQPGIFSPTEGRTSTPDTPAFTAGAKIHERGLHAQRRAKFSAMASDSKAEDGDIASPIRSDDGLLEEEDTGDDPWASLDAAAEAVASGDKEKGQNEGSWFGSAFAGQKSAAAGDSKGGLWGRLTGDSTKSNNPDTKNSSSEKPATKDEAHAEGEGEEVVIGFTDSSHTSTQPKDSASSRGLSISPTQANASVKEKSASPKDAVASSSSPTSSQRPRSPKENANRSTMSRLFQSWPGGASAATSTTNNPATDTTSSGKES